MSTTRYEITVELPNGDWVWTQRELADMHEVMVCALDFAYVRGGRVHHIERLVPIPPIAPFHTHPRSLEPREGVIERIRPYNEE